MERATTFRPQWGARYGLVAYLVTWVFIGLAYSGLQPAVPRGVSALMIDAVWLAAVFPLLGTPNLGQSLGVRRPIGRGTIALTMSMLLAASFADALWAELLHLHVTAESAFSGVRLGGSTSVFFAGASAVVSPIAEEILFRGIIFRGLRERLRFLAASVVVGIMFALVHTQYSLAVLPEIAVYGVGLCWLYERTGSLLPGIAANLYIDCGAFARGLTTSTLPQVVGLGALIVLLLVIPVSLRHARRMPVAG